MELPENVGTMPTTGAFGYRIGAEGIWNRERGGLGVVTAEPLSTFELSGLPSCPVASANG